MKGKVTPKYKFKVVNMCYYAYVLYVIDTNLFCENSDSRVFMIYLTGIYKAQVHEAIRKITWDLCGLTYLFA